MGQVRVKRTNNTKKPKQRSHTRNPKKASLFSCRCQWIVPMIPRALFSRPKLSRPILGKWASFFQLSFRRKVGAKEESNSIDSAVDKPEPRFIGDKGSDESEREEEDCGNDRASMAAVASPPKNALILTRCRSAPYRSSSLARRFWESPLKNEHQEEEKEEKQSTETENREAEKEEEKEKPSNKEEEEEEEEESENKEGLGLELGLGLAVLTRCKSEPARTGEKLGVGPETGFGKNDDSYRERRRRFGFFVNSRSPNVF